MEAIGYFNWVDILIIGLSLKVVFTAVHKGVVVEFFKLCGTLFSIYVPLHYYIVVSDWLRVRAGIKRIPLEFLDFLVFLSLVILSYVVFIFIRAVLAKFLKAEAAPRLNKLGGLLLGMVRAVLLSGLVVFMLVISSISYMSDSARHSYMGRDLFGVTVNTYTWIWNAVASKFMSDEELNKTVLEIQKVISRR